MVAVAQKDVHPRGVVAYPCALLSTTDLPLQLTTFVGRDHELAEVARLLQASRLLTLTGAGGVGKTRLALQSATRAVNEYPDGVWLAALSTLNDGALVPHTVASVLGVGETPGQSTTHTLQSYLQAKQLLLVLDNCEHVIHACAELADQLLRTCPKLRILATSRQRLAVDGETAWRVPSLASPDPKAIAGTDEIAAFGAVQLFVDRARSVDPNFTIGDRNAQAVAQICQRLDGIPLAIELAASRIMVLTPEQIEARLDDCFRLLVGGNRMAPTRQQTLRATLDWSHGLLSEPERTLFRRLSVFTGGFTIEAVESVCSGGTIARNDILDLLTALVDKSLVAVDVIETTVSRYGLLETLRQYGAEHLEDATVAEQDTVHQRHAEYYMAVAEEAEPHLIGAEQGARLDQLERDHGNFRTALQWTIDRTQAATGMRLAAALYRLWYLRGYVREGRRWFEQIIALDGDIPLPARARALRGFGLIAYAEGDLVAARMQTREALALARQLQDTRLVCAALNNLGIVEIDLADYAAARVHCQEALLLARQVHDPSLTPILLNNLGLIAALQADYVAAVPLLEESLAVAEAQGMSWTMAWSTGNLGNAAFYQGDFATAEARYRQSLRLGVDVGDKRIIAERLEELGWVASAQNRSQAAVRLFGAAEVLRETIGAPMPPANRSAHSHAVATARERLGEAGFGFIWSQGRATRLERAIAEALEGGAAAEAAGPLTRRERDVAVLVAQGLSNREIADALVLSVRTVEAHVTHLLSKLDLRSRAQLALWAVEHGLTRVS
jgi:predicted ATPase/DNA-binding CsgD family transcriptional regulator